MFITISIKSDRSWFCAGDRFLFYLFNQLLMADKLYSLDIHYLLKLKQLIINSLEFYYS
ncbi:hypothetical protein [Nostoc sp. FACHB-280]|uniref:hypothetical protein n=1 Tax=Nostoc sp. FACHB-280 TaxID=2692839 RepID=UPI00168B66D9|nr:hypothetical protein [Nostoc sp. FACHB-280]MBD2495558.1 hypothetical protein [Nostoc sp. FACHB-280]